MALGGLDIALSGLRVAQKQLSVISDNISNVSTPGYSRKIMPQEARAVEGQEMAKRVGRNRADNLDHPVGPLHRTRGSFSAEAGNRAVLVPGPAARLGVIAAGALLFFGLGALAARATGKR